MNDLAKTLIFVLVAAGLMALAFTTSSGNREPDFFSDEGEQFFPEFTDASLATALEVIEYDPDQAQQKTFRVEKKDGVWSLPSHHYYPADAEDKMADAAALLIGLTKESIRSDLPEEHIQFGVLDPVEPGSAATGHGKRITFLDSGGNTLASLVIGKSVESNPAKNFVRVPEKKRTYITELPAQLSTKFEDWIEKDLLEVTAYDLQRVFFDNYSIDEDRGTRVDGDRVVVDKPDLDWEVEGIDPETEQVNTETMSTVTSTLAGLEIIGVRPKPPGLARGLAEGGGINLNLQDQLSLQSRGFFVTQNGLLANEGDIHAMTKNGVVYTLSFGEVLFGEGDAVTAGSEAEEKGPTGAPPVENLSANRFLMINVTFDPELVEKPDGSPLPKEHLALRAQARTDIERITNAIERYKSENEDTFPPDLTVLTEGDNPPLPEIPEDPWGVTYAYNQVEEGGFVVSSFGEDKSAGGDGINSDITSDRLSEEDALEEMSRKFEEYEKKLEEGREETDKLRKRFAPWYYVISDESFRKLHVNRDQLVEPKAAEEGTDPPAPPTGG